MNITTTIIPDYNYINSVNNMYHRNDIEIINQRLTQIEEILNIISRDNYFEERYPKLKEIWDTYNTELDKYKLIDIIRDSE